MRRFIGVALALIAVTALACRPLLASPRELLRSLDGRQRVTVGDGVRLAAVFAGLSGGDLDAAASHRALVEAKRLRPSDAADFGATLNRGLACYLFFRAMNAKGGWVSRLFGPSPRYAYKQFVERQFVSPEGENTPISGSELQSMLRLTSAHVQAGGAL